MTEAYVELVLLDRFQVQRDGVFSRRLLINVADTVRCQIDLAVLLVGKLELAVLRIALAGRGALSQLQAATRPYPSYKPTLSCTKRRSSSGRYDGRSAVVRSMLFRNIRHVTREDHQRRYAKSLCGQDEYQ